MDKKLRISQVAQKYSIARSALIYYDNIDLLKPSHIDSNNYRYYTLEDLEKLEMILALKESGLSLKLIGKFMKHPSHRGSITMLKKQKVEVRKKIEELLKLESLIDKRIDIFEQYEGIKSYEGIELNYYEALRVSRVELDYSVDNPLEVATSILKDELDKSKGSLGSIVSKYVRVLPIKEVLAGNYDKYSSLLDYLVEPSKEIEAQIPSGYYVTSLHYGKIEGKKETIDKILDYIKNKDYELGEECYIIPLIDSWACNEEKGFVSEVLIGVDIK